MRHLPSADVDWKFGGSVLPLVLAVSVAAALITKPPVAATVRARLCDSVGVEMSRAAPWCTLWHCIVLDGRDFDLYKETLGPSKVVNECDRMAGLFRKIYTIRSITHITVI
jgi:hypothetical protein